MHPANLPISKIHKIQTVEEDNEGYSYHPCGMLDRDQRTTAFPIEKFKIPLRQSLTQSSKNNYNNQKYHLHHHQHQHQQRQEQQFQHQQQKHTVISQIKDIKQTEMLCLSTTKNFQISEFNRSRTKFHVAFHAFIWILLFTIKINHTKAMPILDSSIDCGKLIIQAHYNHRQTEISINMLNSGVDDYKKAINASDTLFQDWDHKVRKLSTIDVTNLFQDDKPFKQMFTETLKNFTDELHDITKAIKYIILMHNDTNSIEQTKHYLNLTTENNQMVIKAFSEILNHANLNIDLIEHASKNLTLDLVMPKNDDFHDEKSDLRVLEVTTLKQLNETLVFMEPFFSQVEDIDCQKMK